MTGSNAWEKAYLRQARADFETWNVLFRQRVPTCHRLQFLQMACEKLCKAYLIRGGADPMALQSSHAYIAGTLPSICKKHYAEVNGAGPHVLKAIPALARKIELLAPAVKAAGSRPDNCEYPWPDAIGNRVIAPVDHTFEILELLINRPGSTFLKIIQHLLQ